MNARKEDNAGGLEITSSTPPNQLPQFVLPEETATWLRSGKSTIYELIRQGKLEAVKVGRCLRIPRESLIKFIDSGGAELPKRKE